MIPERGSSDAMWPGEFARRLYFIRITGSFDALTSTSKKQWKPWGGGQPWCYLWSGMHVGPFDRIDAGFVAYFPWGFGGFLFVVPTNSDEMVYLYLYKRLYHGCTAM